MINCDNIVIGAGLYGLYSALVIARQGKNVVVLEADSEAFSRATYINQARVHMGYHYPRSISTAVKSKNYFDRFCQDFPDCINSDFEQVYATSSKFSYTNAQQFIKFCKHANIMCEELATSRYFKYFACDGAFLTKEYTYDAKILKQGILKELNGYKNVKIVYNSAVCAMEKNDDVIKITTVENENYCAKFVLNATYASVNELLKMLNFPIFNIKYELCEIILCKVSKQLKDIGITVMDGPFFSIMPFGKTGLHSLTSVTFTPHTASFTELPEFSCQKINKNCKPGALQNCNNCIAKPQSAFAYMSGLAKKYLKDCYEFEYDSSLFSVKPILKASEVDDSRPTTVKKHCENPTFVSVLSGKINTVYDLDEVLLNDSK